MRDLSPLAECLQLRYLILAGTQVSDLNPIVKRKLEMLRLDNSPNVADVSALAECATLETVTITRGVTGIEALRKLPRLRQLSYTYDGQQTESAVSFWKKYDKEVPAAAK